MVKRGHLNFVDDRDEDFRSRPQLTICVTLSWSHNISEHFLLHLKNQNIIPTW